MTLTQIDGIRVILTGFGAYATPKNLAPNQKIRTKTIAHFLCEDQIEDNLVVLILPEQESASSGKALDQTFLADY